MFHDLETVGAIHALQNFSFATTTAMYAGTFTSADIGKIAQVGSSAPYKYFILQNNVGPVFSQITPPVSATGDITYYDATSGSFVDLPIGTAGQVLTVVSGVPAWAASGTSPTQSYELSNVALAASVSADALTIALKTEAGSDPSAGSPCVIGFRSSTSATGTYTTDTVASALSIVVPSGTTIGTANAAASYIYVYAVDNVGTVVLAVSLSKFDEGSVQSTTAISGGSSATTLYSTSALSSKAIRLIGRINITEATAGTWLTAPTEVSLQPFTLFKAPTVQTFLENHYYTFTITPNVAILGDTYTNNVVTFTVVYGETSGTTLVMSASVDTAPTSSGTLVWSSGSGSGNITFSSVTNNGMYYLPTGPTPLYIEVIAIGQGGGGTGAGAGDASAGGNTNFGGTLLVANGGGQGGGSPQIGGTGGTASTGAGVTPIIVVSGGDGGGPIQDQASDVGNWVGGAGGNGPLGGGGAAARYGANGGNGKANTGGGGAGYGSDSSATSGSGGGAGGYAQGIIPNPSSTYTFVLNAIQNEGSSGGTYFGGVGGPGQIIVKEYYQ